MILLKEAHLSEEITCPYFDDRPCSFRQFFAHSVSARELDTLLSSGWRKFGIYYFRPECGPCRQCIPVRVLAGDFIPDKTQRRILKKAARLHVSMGPLDYRDEIYEVYRDHSLSRFEKETVNEEFIATFYTQSCPTMQTEYFYEGNLFGVGFLDRSENALSSIYFAFKHEYGAFSPGTLSVLKEIEFAVEWNLSYYYLGYYISGNRSMSYKNRFHPFEWFHWETARWLPESELEGSAYNRNDATWL